MSDDEVRFNLRLKRQLFDELLKIQQETGRPVADIVRATLDEYVQGRKNGGRREWRTKTKTS